MMIKPPSDQVRAEAEERAVAALARMNLLAVAGAAPSAETRELIDLVASLAARVAMLTEQIDLRTARQSEERFLGREAQAKRTLDDLLAVQNLARAAGELQTAAELLALPPHGVFGEDVRVELLRADRVTRYFMSATWLPGGVHDERRDMEAA